MKIRCNEVYWVSDNGYVAVTYNPFGLGERYKLYRKVIYPEVGESWKFVASFASPITAAAAMRNLYWSRTNVLRLELVLDYNE